MKHRSTLSLPLGLAAALLTLASPAARADTVYLKDGKTISGSVVSTEGDKVQIDADGLTIIVKKSKIERVEMGGAASAPATPATPAAPAPAATSLTIPAGTPMMVSLQQPISSDKAQAGQPFKGALTADVRVGDTVVIPAGTVVTGKVTTAEKARRGARKTPGSVTLELTSVTLGDREVAIATGTQQQAGGATRGSSVRGAARGAAAGAVIAEVGDGDTGDAAAGGALAGAARGLAKPGEEMTIAVGAVLSFSLRTAVAVP